MEDWIGIILMSLFGSILLISEIFLPAHGFIGFVGLAILGYALFRTYMIDPMAGLVGLAILAVVLPTGLVISVKYWHRTPLGRRISPPNPELHAEDRMPVDDMEPLIGVVGRTLTPLRPVGTCEFDGRRVECLSEHGMIERNVKVIGVRLVDRSLEVRPISEEADNVSNA